MDWIVGAIASIAFVIGTTALYRTGNVYEAILEKVGMILKAAIGRLMIDADENAKLLKQYSDRLLELERRIESGLHADANKSAELNKLRTENERLRVEAARRGAAVKKPVQ